MEEGVSLAEKEALVHPVGKSLRNALERYAGTVYAKHKGSW